MVFAFHITAFDGVREFNFGCTYRPCAIASGLLWSDETSGLNLSLFYQGHQRMGVTAVLAPMFSLFGLAGLRMVWGLTMAVVPAAAFAITARLGAGGFAALFAAILGAGLPALALVQDQNRMLLAMSAPAAILMFAHKPRLRVVGGLWAILWAAEPMLVLVAPLSLLWMWARGGSARRRFRNLSVLASGFIIVAAPFVVRLLIMSRGPWLHEHFADIAPQPYEFLGVRFEFPAFLNWPFRETVMRSPYNPVPNLALVPLMVGIHWGLPLLAIPILGALKLMLESRWRPVVFGGGYFVFLAAFLALNENWTQRDKWDIVVMAYLPLFVFAGYGAELFRTRPLVRSISAYIVVLTGLFLGWPFLASMDGKFDRRYAEVWGQRVQTVLPEVPEYIEWERRKIANPPWRPDSLQGRLPSGVSLRFFRHDLLHRDPGKRLISISEAFQFSVISPDHPFHDLIPARLSRIRIRGRDPDLPVRVNVDLRNPPHRGLNPDGSMVMRAECGGPTVRLHPNEPAIAVRVSWNDAPLRVAAVMGSNPQELAVMALRVNLLDESEFAPLEAVDADCLLVHGPPGARVLLTDVLSFDPTREYVYRLENTDAETGSAVFRLMN